MLATTIQRQKKQYKCHFAEAWPLPNTRFARFHLTSARELTPDVPHPEESSTLVYLAPGGLKNPQLVQFLTHPFAKETEITGPVMVHLHVSLSALPESKTIPSEIDIFVTLRHLEAMGK